MTDVQNYLFETYGSLAEISDSSQFIARSTKLRESTTNKTDEYPDEEDTFDSKKQNKPQSQPRKRKRHRKPKRRRRGKRSKTRNKVKPLENKDNAQDSSSCPSSCSSSDIDDDDDIILDMDHITSDGTEILNQTHSQLDREVYVTNGLRQVMNDYNIQKMIQSAQEIKPSYESEDDDLTSTMDVKVKANHDEQKHKMSPLPETSIKTFFMRKLDEEVEEEKGWNTLCKRAMDDKTWSENECIVLIDEAVVLNKKEIFVQSMWLAKCNAYCKQHKNKTKHIKFGVIIGYPSGQTCIAAKIGETKYCLKHKCERIVLYVACGKIISRDWKYVKREVNAIYKIVNQANANGNRCQFEVKHAESDQISPQTTALFQDHVSAIVHKMNWQHFISDK